MDEFTHKFYNPRIEVIESGKPAAKLADPTTKLVIEHKKTIDMIAEARKATFDCVSVGQGHDGPMLKPHDYYGLDRINREIDTLQRKRGRLENAIHDLSNLGKIFLCDLEAENKKNQTEIDKREAEAVARGEKVWPATDLTNMIMKNNDKLREVRGILEKVGF